MNTTPEERRSAVQLARTLTSTPGIADDVRLLCRVLLDCASHLRLQHPVIYAATRMIDSTGHWTGRWTALYQDELVPAVVAIHKANRTTIEVHEGERG